MYLNMNHKSVKILEDNNRSKALSFRTRRRVLRHDIKSTIDKRN